MYKYLHHISDFVVDTAHLSPLEECFYRRALDFYYLNEKPLPKETQSVFRRLRAITQEEKEATLNILQDFFTEQDDGFHNKRCDAEISEYHQNANKNRENGKKGGRPPKNKPKENPNSAFYAANENPKETDWVSLGYENETQKNLNHKRITDNHKPITINHSVETHTQGESTKPQEQAWSPDQVVLLNVIRESVGVQAQSVLDMPDYKFHLGNFNAHWEDKILLTENQRTRKFAAWLIAEFKKPQQTKFTKNNHEQPNRNVNDKWKNEPQVMGNCELVELPEGFV